MPTSEILDSRRIPTISAKKSKDNIRSTVPSDQPKKTRKVGKRDATEPSDIKSEPRNEAPAPKAEPRSETHESPAMQTLRAFVEKQRYGSHMEDIKVTTHNGETYLSVTYRSAVGNLTDDFRILDDEVKNPDVTDDKVKSAVMEIYREKVRELSSDDATHKRELDPIPAQSRKR